MNNNKNWFSLFTLDSIGHIYSYLTRLSVCVCDISDNYYVCVCVVQASRLAECAYRLNSLTDDRRSTKRAQTQQQLHFHETANDFGILSNVFRVFVLRRVSVRMNGILCRGVLLYYNIRVQLNSRFVLVMCAR